MKEREAFPSGEISNLIETERGPVLAVLAELGYTLGWQDKKEIVFYRSLSPDSSKYPRFHLNLRKTGLKLHYDLRPHRLFDSSGEAICQELERMKNKLEELKDKKYNAGVREVLQKEIKGVLLTRKKKRD